MSNVALVDDGALVIDPDIAFVTGPRGASGPAGRARGAYSGATAYDAGDIVTDQGSSWVSLVGTTGHAPPALPTQVNTYWQIVAQGSDISNDTTLADDSTTQGVSEHVLKNWTTFATPIGYGGSMVPASIKERFRWTANAATDGSCSVFESNGITIKDNAVKLQEMLDNMLPDGGAIFLPPWDGYQAIETSPLIHRGTSGGKTSQTVAIIGMGAGERTRGVRNSNGGTFEQGNGLKLKAGSTQALITSEDTAGILVLENLILDINVCDVRGINFVTRGSGYGFGGFFKDITVTSAGRANIFVAANRNMGYMDNVWSVQAQGGNSEASIELQTYDWEIHSPGIGNNAGVGLRVTNYASQIQINDGAIWNSGLEGLIVEATCRTVTVTSTEFDGNGREGIKVYGYSGGTKGGRNFNNVKFRNSSKNTTNTYSDFSYTGKDSVLTAPVFEGDANGLSKLPKWCIEARTGEDAGSEIQVSLPLYSSGSYGTAFTNDASRIITAGSKLSGNYDTLDGASYRKSVKLTAVTVSALPSAATVGAGTSMFVSDANATTYNSVVAGGGSNGLRVTSDGTNWRIG